MHGFGISAFIPAAVLELETGWLATVRDTNEQNKVDEHRTIKRYHISRTQLQNIATIIPGSAQIGSLLVGQNLLQRHRQLLNFATEI